MIEVRPLHKADLFKIKDCLVEQDQHLSYEMADYAENSGTSFTYVKDDKVVGCCGAGLVDGVYNVWAVYSRAFSAIIRARCMKAFIKKLRTVFVGKKALIAVNPALRNVVKFVKFLGGKYVRCEYSPVMGIIYTVYEVA